MGRAGIEPANGRFHLSRGATGRGTIRSCPVEKLRVVEFRLVREDMRVGVSGDREVALTDLLADTSPRHPAQRRRGARCEVIPRTLAQAS
jgi:hypothetical protein